MQHNSAKSCKHYVHEINLCRKISHRTYCRYAQYSYNQYILDRQRTGAQSWKCLWILFNNAWPNLSSGNKGPLKGKSNEWGKIELNLKPVLTKFYCFKIQNRVTNLVIYATKKIGCQHYLYYVVLFNGAFRNKLMKAGAFWEK